MSYLLTAAAAAPLQHTAIVIYDTFKKMFIFRDNFSSFVLGPFLFSEQFVMTLRLRDIRVQRMDTRVTHFWKTSQ